MSAYSHQGLVYFAACGKYVKIGYSSGDLAKRIAMLPRGVVCPADLDRDAEIEVVHTIKGCVMRDERRLHGLLAAHRAEGEWFHYNLAFIQQLDRMQYVTYAETLLLLRRARADLKRSRSAWLGSAAA